MFSHVFNNHLKVLLRKRTMIFWTLVFPLVLATFFNLAFANLLSSESFNPVNIAVVDDDNFKAEANFKTVIEQLSKDEDKIFNTTYVDYEKAKQLLEDNKVEAYIIVKDKIEVIVKYNGLAQTITKSVIDNYYQTISVIGHIISFYPKSFNHELIEKINADNEYFKDGSSKNVDLTVVYFYTLIGMACLYGGLFGMNAVNETEANLSKRGARTSVAPTHKLMVLLASLLVAFLVQYAEVLILLGYLFFVLGINFGNQIGYILLLTLMGSLAGITLGTVVGSSNKKSLDVKVGILITTTMLFSFLSGMMIVQMKHIIAKNVPIIGAINPVNMITDGLYALYYYDTLDRYIYNIVSLGIFSLVMILISYYFLRRKTYDSI